MNCDVCKRPMSALFLSQACDYCDFGVAKEKLHRGFVLHPSSPEEYVFQTRVHAERWLAASGRAGCVVQEVYSLTPYRWHLATGYLRDIVLADHMFEIFQDHRFEPLPHRAFLAKGSES